MYPAKVIAINENGVHSSSANNMFYRSYFGLLTAFSTVPSECKKVALATFVDISAVRANFCMKFYVTVKQSDIQFITKFGLKCIGK